MASLMDLIAGYSLPNGLLNMNYKTRNRAGQPVQPSTDTITNAITQGLLPMLASAGIGTGAGIAGQFGEAENLGRLAINKLGGNVNPNTTLPTQEGILSYLNSITPLKPYTDNTYTEIGANLLAPILDPTALITTARASKPVAKAVGEHAWNKTEDMMQQQGLMPNILPPSQYIGKPLKGLPNVVKVGNKLEEFGTDQRLVDIAKDYVANKGFVYIPQIKYADLDPDRAKKLAQAYEKMQNNPNNPAVKKSYDALIEETMGQYEALRKKGYKFDFMPQSGDVYNNPRNAINDIVLNKHLSVFPTEQGFGGPLALKASETNPLLMRIGEKWNGKDVTANDVFRAVHDVFGHAKHGVGFRAAGEENAFQSHARMYSPEALPAITSETRGQNSWVNYGPYGQLNRSANPFLTEYAEQKAGIMPSWTWKEGLLK